MVVRVKSFGFFLLTAVTTGAGMSACESKKTDAPAVVAPGNVAPAAIAPAPAAAKSDVGHVLYTTSLKREPSEKPKIDDPAGKSKQVANWIASLYRGEKVTVGKEDGDYLQVKTSGEVEGWVKKQSLLVAPDVSEATVLEPSDAFDRPDLLALNSKKKITPGTLLFVVKNREQFSEVNAAGATTVWVLSGRVSTDANEISVAKLLAKARSLKEGQKGEGTADILNLARSNFASAKLFAVMDAELGGPASADVAGEVDPKPTEPKNPE